MSSANVSGSPGGGGKESESQIAKMILFIEQEAEEKIREIKVKAQGEAIKEQGKMILVETQQINEAHKRRLKQAEVSHRIEHTGRINQHRLKLYKQREELVGDLFEKVKKKIEEIAADKNKYPEIMKGLMLQVMYGMISPKVIVKCRKCDEELVKQLIPVVQGIYLKETETKCELILDTKSYLPDSAIGGVVMSIPDGTIMVDGTLSEKLKLLYNRIPPNMSKELFGSFSIDEVPVLNA